MKCPHVHSEHLVLGRTQELCFAITYGQKGGKTALCVPFSFFFFILLSCLSLRKQNRLNSLLVPCGEI